MVGLYSKYLNRYDQHDHHMSTIGKGNCVCNSRKAQLCLLWVFSLAFSTFDLTLEDIFRFRRSVVIHTRFKQYTFFTWYPWSYFIMMCSSLSLHTLSLLFGDFLWKALLYIYFRYVYIVHPSPCLDVVSFFLRSSQKVNTYCIMSICIYTSLTILEVHEIWVN